MPEVLEVPNASKLLRGQQKSLVYVSLFFETNNKNLPPLPLKNNVEITKLAFQANQVGYGGNDEEEEWEEKLSLCGYKNDRDLLSVKLAELEHCFACLDTITPELLSPCPFNGKREEPLFVEHDLPR